jgi:hypothetical protein
MVFNWVFCRYKNNKYQKEFRELVLALLILKAGQGFESFLLYF